LFWMDISVKAQRAAVTAQIEIMGRSADGQPKTAGKSASLSDVALWLEPVGHPARRSGGQDSD